MTRRGATASAADGAVVGASIRTLDASRPTATAVAWRDGRVVAVGTDDEVRAACGPATELLDGAGTWIYPGFVDAHHHPVWGCELTRGVDLAGCADADDVRAALAAERRRCGREWVQAYNAEHAQFAAVGIRSSVIDDAVAGAPALVMFSDLHTALGSSEGLRRAGIVGPLAAGEVGEVVCEDGRPTGELREFAHERLERAMPPRTHDELLDEVAAHLRDLSAVGLTGVHAMDGSAADVRIFRELEGSGRLPVRVLLPVWVKPQHDDEQLDALIALRDVRGARWRGGIAKFFLDGVVESGTAWLDEPDVQGDGTTTVWPSPEAYTRAVGRFAAAGFQCVTHAMGDRAVRWTLDAYRAAGPVAAGPHRVEHVDLLPADCLPRFSAEGVVASIQPNFAANYFAADGDDDYRRLLGADRRQRAERCADLVRSGATYAIGSDWPVTSFDPRVTLAAGMLRRRPGDPWRGRPGFAPEQALTADELIEGYTLGAARTAGCPDAGGRIAPGLPADLSGFGARIESCAADDLPDVPVRLTVVAGEVTHRG